MGPLCRGPVWMPITPKRGPFCTPIHKKQTSGTFFVMSVYPLNTGHRPDIARHVANACRLGSVDKRVLRFDHIHEGSRDHEDSIDAVEGRSQAARSRHVALADLNSRDIFEPRCLCPIPHQDSDRHSLAHEFVGYE